MKEGRGEENSMQPSSNRCLLCSEKMEKGKRWGKERLCRQEKENIKETDRKAKEAQGEGLRRSGQSGQHWALGTARSRAIRVPGNTLGGYATPPPATTP